MNDPTRKDAAEPAAAPLPTSSSPIVDALAWQVTMTNRIVSAFGDPHAELTRAAALRRGLVGVGGGVGAWAFAGLLLSMGFGGGPVAAPILGGLLGIGYGVWFLRRAVGSNESPSLTGSDCWECAARIESATAGAFCEVCTRPVHLRCRAKHARTVHG